MESWMNLLKILNLDKWFSSSFSTTNRTWTSPSITNHLHKEFLFLKVSFRSKKSLQSTSSWNLVSNSIIKFNSILHANEKSMGFMQWVRGLDGQFLLTKMIFSKFFVQHQQNVVKIPAMENIHAISIWLAVMLRICHAKMAMVKNLCSS